MRGKDYFDDLTTADQAKIWALIERMGDTGEIRNVEKFRHEGDGLYCFKSFKRRLMCFLDGNDVVITHGFTKKRDRLDKRELDRAKRIREHHRTNRAR